MGLKGDLDSISLADIFQTLSMTGQEGTLHVRNATVTKYIYFAPDGVTLLTSGEKKKRLGDLLVGLGKISADDLKDSLFQQKQTGALLGETLIQMGLVSDQDIENAVRFQIEEEIYDLFAWDNASFEFHEGSRPEDIAEDVDQTVTQLRFNVNSLIMEAARRADEWEKIEQYIPSTDAIFKLESTARRGEYTDQESLILDALDGDRSVDEVVSLTHVPRFDVCRFIARCVEEGKARRAPVEWLLERGDALRAAGDELRALNFYRQACESGLRKRGEQVDARRRLAEVLESLGEKKEAGEEYKILADLRAEEHDVEGAINYWQKVIDLNPLDLENKERLISVYLENRTHLDPDRSDVIRGIEYSLFKNGKALAMAFSYAGQVEKAREVLERLIDITPSNVELRKALVNIHVEHDSKAEAVDELERIASYQVSQRSFDDVAAAYRNILKLAPDREDIKRKLGLLEQQQSGPSSPDGGPARKKRNPWPAVVVMLFVAAGGAYVGYNFWWAPKDAAPLRAELEKLDQGLKAITPESPFPDHAEAYAKAAKEWRALADKYPFSSLAGEAATRADQIDAAAAVHKQRYEKATQQRADTLRIKAETLGDRAERESWDTTEIEAEIAEVSEQYADNPEAATAIQELAALAKRIADARRGALARLAAVNAAAERGRTESDALAEAWRLALDLRADPQVESKFPETVWGVITFPYRVESTPAGATIMVDGKALEQPTPHTQLGGAFRERLAIEVTKRGYRRGGRSLLLGEDPEGPVARIDLQLDVWYAEPFTAREQLPATILHPWRWAGDAWITIARNGHVESVAPLADRLAMPRPRIVTKKTEGVEMVMRNAPTGTPAVAGELLVTNREDGHVLAFDRANPATAKWDYAMFDPAEDEETLKAESTVGSPVIDMERGLVFAASSLGRLHAIRVGAEGAAKAEWKSSPLGERDGRMLALTQPVVVGNYVVAVTTDGTLIGLDAEKGELGKHVFLYPAMPNSRVIHPPVAVAAGVVLLVTSDGARSALHAFDLSRPLVNGQAVRLWEPVQLHGQPQGSPVVTQGAVPAVLVTVDARDGGRRLEARDLTSGSPLWPNLNKGEGIAIAGGLETPAVHDGRIYLVAGNKFFVHDLKTGAQRHTLTFKGTERAVTAPVVDSQGRVLLTFADSAKQGQPHLYVVKE